MGAVDLSVSCSDSLGCWLCFARRSPGGRDGACGCELVGVGWLGAGSAAEPTRLRPIAKAETITAAMPEPGTAANGAFLRWCWVDRCRQELLPSGPPQVTVRVRPDQPANITDTGETQRVSAFDREQAFVRARRVMCDEDRDPSPVC